MGSQLAKSDSTQSTTARRQPKAATSEGDTKLHSNLTNTSSLVVVNSGRTDSASAPNTNQIRLPHLQPPLIPVGQISLHHSIYPQLESQPLLDLAIDFQGELRKNAERIAQGQQRLGQRLKEIDVDFEKVGILYVSEKQRRLNRASENFGKLSEIETLLERCQTDIEHLCGQFTRLNRALPEPLKLEEFASIEA